MDAAALRALEWCEKHKGWKRICDIKNIDALYKTWEELSEKERKRWINYYHDEYTAQRAWEELGHKPRKVPYGFISGKGNFYKKITDFPLSDGVMMVYKIDC